MHSGLPQQKLMMFRTFVSFCIYMSIAVESIDVNGPLAFLECLSYNQTSVNMLATYLSAIKANFNVLGLNAAILENKRLKYYIRSIKLNRPVCLSTKNVISVEILQKIIRCCDTLYMGSICKAVFLVAFWGFQIWPFIHFPLLIYPGTLLLVTVSSLQNL